MWTNVVTGSWKDKLANGNKHQQTTHLINYPFVSLSLFMGSAMKKK